jgi:hypothetical protein
VARFACGFRSAGAGSATLPLGSLYATAVCEPKIVEIGVFNTTSTAVAVGVVRLSAGAGTPGAGLTEIYEDDDSRAGQAVATVFNTHTVTPTTISTPLRQASLGAAVGSGIIWTFGGGKTVGLLVPNTTTDGIGLIIPTGTGQVCDIHVVWDE